MAGSRTSAVRRHLRAGKGWALRPTGRHSTGTAKDREIRSVAPDGGGFIAMADAQTAGLKEMPGWLFPPMVRSRQIAVTQRMSWRTSGPIGGKSQPGIFLQTQLREQSPWR